eukprot:974002-Lingulodinium_polyedra.AAC.1
MLPPVSFSSWVFVAIRRRVLSGILLLQAIPTVRGGVCRACGIAAIGPRRRAFSGTKPSRLLQLVGRQPQEQPVLVRGVGLHS